MRFDLILEDENSPVLEEDLEFMMDCMEWGSFLMHGVAWQTTLDASGCIDSELL